MTIEHTFVDTSLGKLHVASSGSGPLLIFLHGFPEFWYAWHLQLEQFAASHHCLAPDLPGYNLSDKPSQLSSYEIPSVVKAIIELIDKFSTSGKATIVGHDWGGVLSWYIACLYPEKLEKLVIINSPHPAIFSRELASNPAQQKASMYIGLFVTPLAEPTLSANNYAHLAKVVFDGCKNETVFSHEDRAKYLKAWQEPGALTGGLNYYRANALAKRQKITVCNVDTLVIWGENDTALLTGNLNGLEDLVPRLTIKRVPNAGHWIVHEEPELVGQYIQDFLCLSKTEK